MIIPPYYHRCSRKRTTFLLLAKALLAFSVEHFFQIPRRGTPRPPRIIKIVSEKSARVVRLVAHPRLPLWCCLVLILGGRGVGAARKTCGRAEIRCVSMKKGWCVCVSTRGGLSRGSRAGARAALPKPGRKSPRSHANMVLWDAKSMSLFCSPWWQLRGRQGAPKRRNKLMITIVLSRRGVGALRGSRAAGVAHKIRKAGPISWGQLLEQFSEIGLGLGPTIWGHFFAYFRNSGPRRAARARAANSGRRKYYRDH